MGQWFQAVAYAGMPVSIGLVGAGIYFGARSHGNHMRNSGPETLDNLRRKPLVVQIGNSDRPMVVRLGPPAVYIRKYEAVFDDKQSTSLPAEDTDEALDLATEQGAPYVKRYITDRGIKKQCRVYLVPGASLPTGPFQ